MTTRRGNRSPGLAEAALRVSLVEYPDLDINAYLGRFDQFTQAIEARLRPDSSVVNVLTEINRYLFHDQGFSGNRDNYYDPRNSYLNDVLDRKLGIPILLSVIYIEVGRRLGLRVKGVNFPGHFLVRVTTPGGDLFLDPYADGISVGVEELNLRLRKLFGARAPTLDEQPELLSPTSSRDILLRILRNLKLIYLHRGDVGRLLSVLDKILEIDPKSAAELRDRGRLYQQLCYSPKAVKDFKRYLELSPEAEDAQDVRSTIMALSTRRMYLH